MDKVKYFLKHRPLLVLAIMGGVRDLLFGIGFVVGFDQITRTLIYQNYDELVPGYTGLVAGILLLGVGLAVVVSSLTSSRRLLLGSLKFQSALWLFSTLMYILNGYWLLAGVFGVFFSLPALFVAMHIKHHSYKTLQRE